MNVALFALLTAFWGFSFIAIRFSVEAFPPFAAAGLRTGIAMVFLLVLAILQRVPPPRSKALLGKLALLGLANCAVPWACLFWGEQYVLPAIAAILNSSVPLFVFIFSWMILPNDRPNRIDFLGVTLGFVGIFFVFAPSIQKFSLNQESFYGMIAIMVMAISYGIGTTGVKRIGRQCGFLWMVAVQCVSATFVLFALSGVTEGWLWTEQFGKNLKATYSVVYLAIFSTALAWLIYFRLVNVWSALRASTVTYLVPFIAILADLFYFRKLPTFNQLVGALLIMSAIGLMQFSRLYGLKTGMKGHSRKKVA